MRFSLPLLLHHHNRWSFSAISTTANNYSKEKEKLVVIMGATGAGKSGLSIDLATRFSGEVINSDKIQLYEGLNITTNKIPIPDRNGVPHHLLGVFPSSAGDVSPSQYSRHAASVVTEIHSRRRVPFLVGGSNSLIQELILHRYRCCFLWVDMSAAVLDEYLDKRVDDMVKSGMVEELGEYYNSGEINESKANTGLRKAIGVAEFERYFDAPPCCSCRREAYEEAVRSIKEKTRELAKRQVEKIQRAKRSGWDLQRLDATDAFRRVVDGTEGWRSAWERRVVEPSIDIVRRFLEYEE